MSMSRPNRMSSLCSTSTPTPTDTNDADPDPVNRNNEKRPTVTFYLTFQGTSLPWKVRLGFERFDVDLYIPFPRRCFKCQKYGHNSRTCRATAVSAMSAHCAQVQVTNKTGVQTSIPWCVQTAMVHILLSVENAQHVSMKKEVSRSKQRLHTPCSQRTSWTNFLQP